MHLLFHQPLRALRTLARDYYLRSARYPWIFLSLSRLLVGMGFSGGAFINKRTEFAIMGFPRTGNTFALWAFRFAHRQPVEIASHSHLSAHVVMAVKKGIPTLVLVRRPEDAVISLVIRNSSISIKQALEDYIHYYSRVKPHRSRYVLATFDDVTTDFGGVIERVNNRFGVAFSRFEHSAANVKEVFNLIDQADMKDHGLIQVTETMVARPSSERADRKTELAREFEKLELKDLLVKAQDLYLDFAEQQG